MSVAKIASRVASPGLVLTGVRDADAATAWLLSEMASLRPGPFDRTPRPGIIATLRGPSVPRTAHGLRPGAASRDHRDRDARPRFRSRGPGSRGRGPCPVR